MVEAVLDRRYLRTFRRRAGFAKALDLIVKRNLKTIVETGTCRSGEAGCKGDGCSTLLFGHLISLMNQKSDDQAKSILYTVDINSLNIRRSEAAAAEYKKDIRFIHQNSLEFLENFNSPIDFLYLDSFDFSLGVELESQKHHLKELKLALPNIHENSVIAIDDCELRLGGKCRLVEEYLLNNGWHKCFNEYQHIFISKPELED